LEYVGWSASPSDGSLEAKIVSDYICNNSGGNCAFRELADLILIYKKSKL